MCKIVSTASKINKEIVYHKAMCGILGLSGTLVLFKGIIEGKPIVIPFMFLFLLVMCFFAYAIKIKSERVILSYFLRMEHNENQKLLVEKIKSLRDATKKEDLEDIAQFLSSNQMSAIADIIELDLIRAEREDKERINALKNEIKTLNVN